MRVVILILIMVFGCKSQQPSASKNESMEIDPFTTTTHTDIKVKVNLKGSDNNEINIYNYIIHPSKDSVWDFRRDIDSLKIHKQIDSLNKRNYRRIDSLWKL